MVKTGEYRQISLKRAGNYCDPQLHPLAIQAGIIEFNSIESPAAIRFKDKHTHAFFAGLHLQKVGLKQGLPSLGYREDIKKVDKRSYVIVISMVHNSPDPLATMEELIEYDPILAARCVCGNLKPTRELRQRLVNDLMSILNFCKSTGECACLDCARELARLKALETIPVMVQAARNAPTPMVRRKLLKKVTGFGSAAIPVLLEALDGEDNQYFDYYLFDALGRIGDPAPLEQVRPYTLSDNLDLRTRMMGLSALVRMGDSEALEALQEAAEDPNLTTSENLDAWHALASTGKGAAALMVESLQAASQDSGMEENFIIAVKFGLGKKAAKPLKQMLENRDTLPHWVLPVLERALAEIHSVSQSGHIGY